MGYKPETCGHRQQCGGYPKEGVGRLRGGGGLIVVTEHGFTRGGGHTVQYADLVS